MLSKKQMEAVTKFWKRGWFWAWDLNTIFATEISKRNCVKVLTALKIIEEHSYKFMINREEFLNYQKQYENSNLGNYT